MEDNSRLTNALLKYKRFAELAKSDYGIDYKITKTDSSIVSIRKASKVDTALLSMQIAESQDSILEYVEQELAEYKFLYSLAKKHYGIDYIVERKNGKIFTERKVTKADSALVLFKYFKHRLSFEDNEWIIETDKAYRKALRKKKRNKN